MERRWTKPTEVSIYQRRSSAWRAGGFCDRSGSGFGHLALWLVSAAMEGAYHGHRSGWPRRGTAEAKAARGLSKQRGAATWEASWWRASIDWHGHRRGWGGSVVDSVGVEKNVACSFFGFSVSGVRANIIFLIFWVSAISLFAGA
jgi:hypothetical protein